MPSNTDSLQTVFDGWEGYLTSVIHAVTPLTSEQLAFRPAPNMRSVGELVRHMALGRIDWFRRMDAPGNHEVVSLVTAWDEDPHGNKYIIDTAFPITEDATQLIYWLETTGQMITKTLNTWTVDDLKQTYWHVWRGTTYAVSRQWTLWRMMAHDLHHGGELSTMLGMQGLENFELGDLGGHITEPARADVA